MDLIASLVSIDFKAATLIHRLLSGIHHRTYSQRLPFCRRCSWATTMFHNEPNVRCDADIQHLRRWSVCSCWTRTMEQSSIAPERGRLVVQ